MKEQRGLTIFISISAVIFIILMGMIVWKAVKKVPVNINNFDDCMKAGYPVTETNPSQCETSEGKTFTQEVPPTKEPIE